MLVVCVVKAGDVGTHVVLGMPIWCGDGEVCCEE
jgi:hypothetical protein